MGLLLASPADARAGQPPALLQHSPPAAPGACEGRTKQGIRHGIECDTHVTFPKSQGTCVSNQKLMSASLPHLCTWTGSGRGSGGEESRHRVADALCRARQAGPHHCQSPGSSGSDGSGSKTCFQSPEFPPCGLREYVGKKKNHTGKSF